MKMVKSLLLGSAAGLIAVTAGQAAELPVKARAVEYVKVCSLYGAGFYYMPGTDMCIKIGGWVRAEATWGINGNMTWGAFNGNVNNRLTSNLGVRDRGYITADAREQTAYGTARGYIAVGASTSDTGFNNAANQFSANRAFVQWAGMTAGLAQSFYDFYSLPAANYRAGNIPASDTGDGGWWVWGYTAQFGGGLSATLAVEDRRTTQIINQNCTSGPSACGSSTPGSFPAGIVYNNTLDDVPGQLGILAAGVGAGGGLVGGAGAYGGWQAPDIVANMRIDQAWGSAQIMGALHEVNPSYYSTGFTDTTLGPVVTDGHPGNQWGFAVGAGLKVNFPSVAQGDYFQSQFNYSEGAARYNFNTPDTNWGRVDGSHEAYGVLSDCIYGGTIASGTATSCQLTTAWGFNASYEHYWTPQWHESFTGWYSAVSYNNAANAMLCADSSISSVTGTITQPNGAGYGTAAVAGGVCNNNWNVWGVGTRLQWDVTKTFYLGVEVLYEDLHSAVPAAGVGGTLGANYNPANSTATLQEANSDAWIVTVRAHKDFLP